jgi:cytochrome c556
MGRKLAAAALVWLLAGGGAAFAADPRELVSLPAPMQEHMMGNMRDHLRALEEVLAALAAGRIGEAGETAERRIGMSSLEMHGASHMAPFMPEPMRQMGTALHRAASRLAVAAQDADTAHTYEAQREVFAALREMMAACNACHASYRIR